MSMQNDEELTRWAESDAPLSNLRPGSVYSGEEARRITDELLASTTAGRPTLGHSRAQGTGASPRRQVCLPNELDRRLAAYLASTGMSASQFLREAVEARLDMLEGPQHAA